MAQRRSPPEGAGLGDLFSPRPTRLALSDAQRLAWLRLIRSDGVGPRTFMALIRRFGSAEAALEGLPELGREHGRTIRPFSREAAERELAAMHRVGARLIALGEAEYPLPLRAIADPPPLLCLRGQVETLLRPGVAIVGSRSASAAGLRMAELLSSGLGRAGYVVISGLARGIDTAAHRAALETGTIGVFAGGIGRPYPPDNEALMAAILDRGALVSEMPYDWEPRGRDFPRRNRLISGLARGVVLVEAAERSGSLITKRFAAEQGRTLYAVPGHPLDPRSAGPNGAIREGATMVLDVEDILADLAPEVSERDLAEPRRIASAVPDEPLFDELLEATAPFGSRPAPRTMSSTRDETSSVCELDAGEASPALSEDQLLALLGPTAVEVDDFARRSGLRLSDLQALLAEWELAGRIERVAGQRIQRRS